MHNHTTYMRERRATEKGRRENQRNAARSRMRRKRRLLAGRSCADCGNDDLRVLQLHHPDPSVKTCTIGHYQSAEKDAACAAEIAACIVLCANCHAIREVVWMEAK